MSVSSLCAMALLRQIDLCSNQVAQVQFVGTTPRPLRQSQPIHHPLFALVPSDCPVPDTGSSPAHALLIPIVCSVQLLVCGIPLTLRWHVRDRHFSLNSTTGRLSFGSLRTRRSISTSSLPPSRPSSLSSFHIRALHQSHPSISASRFHSHFLTCKIHIPCQARGRLWWSTPRCSTTGL